VVRCGLVVVVVVSGDMWMFLFYYWCKKNKRIIRS